MSKVSASLVRAAAYWTILFALQVGLATAQDLQKGQPLPAAIEEILRNPEQTVRYFAPNDPLFADPTYGQWHLDHTTRPHANLVPAWANGITGAGVTIGIADDSLQHAHPDLSPNYSATHSFDFGQGDGDPSPVHANSGPGTGDGDNHGTAVAGVAAGRGGNALGITGAAPHATVAGLRIDFPFQTTAMFVGATLYRSDGVGANGNAIQVKNHSYGIGAPYISNGDTAAQLAALKTSYGAGTIHAFAAGNDRFDFGAGGNFGDANKKVLQSAPESIAVAALGADGVFAFYSNFGANVFVTAPSSGAGIGITTTDRTAGGLTGGYNDTAGSGTDGDGLPDLNYTSGFGGTSSATPLVSGILALGKSVNPNMDTRLAKHLLVRTSQIVDALDATATSDGGWTTNAAGHSFNQNYGFGLVDADAFTQMAPLFTVTPQQQETTGTLGVSLALPDAVVNAAVPGSLTQMFNLFNAGELEEVLVTLNVAHTWIGDLQATLTSPSGTTSRLMYRDIFDSNDNLLWTFTDNAFWGESPVGQWTLTLEDWFSADTGIWNSFSVTAFTGSLLATPEPASVAAWSVIVLALLGVGWHRSRRAA